jgi:hypothetical protein
MTNFQWVTRSGDNLTAEQVASRINRATGGTYTAETLNRAYRVGAIYRNGGLWFQRIS